MCFFTVIIKQILTNAEKLLNNVFALKTAV